MLLFHYLDRLPHIPPALVGEPASFEPESRQWTAQSRSVQTTEVAIKNLQYTRWSLTAPLGDWIREHISDGIDQLGLQISEAKEGASTHVCHTDSHPRRWVLNYLLDTGGLDVWTHFYQERGHPMVREHLLRPRDMNGLEKLHSVKIKPGRWFLLNAVVLHDATGIETSRRAVTAAFAADNPFNSIKGYEGLLSLE